MKQGTCKHFNGAFHNPTCEAGVCYADVTPDWDSRTGRLLRLPCRQVPCSTYTPEQAAQFARRGTCPKYAEPSDEEIAAYEAEGEAMVERMKLTFGVTAKVKREHAGREWKGAEPCPVCGGVLHMTHSAFNGHVWGKCETPDCVSWME